MKRPNVFARAAKLVEDDEARYACTALSEALTGDGWSFAHGRRLKPSEVKFRAYFAPTPAAAATLALSWFGATYKLKRNGDFVVHKQHQNQRVLALAFAAAMRDAGDM